MANNVFKYLYPPIVGTYAPTFVIGQDPCRVYFSISPYNKRENIKQALVSIRNQNSNKSVLNRNKYPSDILITEGIQEDLSREGSDKYFIEISNMDLENGFQKNQFYKIQICFSGIPIPTDEPIGSWMTKNQSYLSEWSTICLVHGISRPSLDLKPFPNNVEQSGSLITISQTSLTLSGKLKFENDEKETLRSYKIKLYELLKVGDIDEKTLISEGEEIYTSDSKNINDINYTLETLLEEGRSYRLEVIITTRNLYTTNFIYNFLVRQDPLDKLYVNLDVESSTDLGSLKINMTPLVLQNFTGTVIFRRTSSESNFQKWEDIHSTNFKDTILNYSWYDCSVESGVWYKYCVQEIKEGGLRGIAVIQDKPTMVEIEDMFLISQDKQLKVCFDNLIGDMKRNVSEAKIETLGGKYPFIKRNGDRDYREFSISGLITIHTDYEETFVKKEELFTNKKILNLYEDYNTKQGITNWNDYIYEKKFREKVIDFLFEDKVKLLKTRTEGNFLVKLMNISLTPKKELGNMIYSFSAQANEIDEFSLKKLNQYNIINYITLDKDIPKKEKIYVDKMGQLFQKVPAKQNILENILIDYFQKDFLENNFYKVNFLSKAQLNFTSPPYLIKEEGQNLIPLEPEDPIDETVFSGYIIKINGKDIYVPNNGTYELVKNSKIYSLSFPVETDIVLDFVANIEFIEGSQEIVNTLSYYNRVGQLWGIFYPRQSLLDELWEKYFIDYKDAFYRRLLSLNSINIEASPGTVFLIRGSEEDSFHRIVVNDTGRISYYQKNQIITGLHFLGKHFEIATEEELQRDYLEPNKVIDTKQVISSFDEVKNPIEKGLYYFTETVYKTLLTEHIDGEVYGFIDGDTPSFIEDSEIIIKPGSEETITKEFYDLLVKEVEIVKNKAIFYQGKWHLLTKDNDLICPVEALVDYWCEIEKGVYA